MTDALDYHRHPTPGKIAITTTTPLATQQDLALAYSPGVAEPCLAIQNDAETAYEYTNKSNTVAVISNGTAVLGLGNIGALASKPVMEGKAALFKTFANIDAIDIELNEADPEKLIEHIAALEPSFGGINLEDIKAPECFMVEDELKKRLKIPVFHDDQHGTAIVAVAAIVNGLEIAGKTISNIRIVINGAGAAGIAIYNLLKSFGAPDEHIIMCDSQGIIACSRPALAGTVKEVVCTVTDDTHLAEAVEGADVFIGVSVADLLTPEMLSSMSRQPIVLAMANPNPEINYQLAMQTRDDVLMGTGRSDLPNQVNNVLCFPFLFRAALDVRASEINEPMKHAAVHALASLAKEPVTQDVLNAYNLESLSFGSDYILPKPFDTRVADWVVPAVTKAAIESGVSKL